MNIRDLPCGICQIVGLRPRKGEQLPFGQKSAQKLKPALKTKLYTLLEEARLRS